jgi:hypothetical protein
MICKKEEAKCYIPMLNIDKYSIKVYKQSIFPAISFAVTDNQLEEDAIPSQNIDGIVLSLD